MDHTTLSRYVNKLLEADCFDDGSINGLQFEGTRPIRKIGTAVTASLNVIKKAQELDIDALFVHHGLFLRGAISDIRGVLRRKIELLINSGIHLYGYHLPIDAHTALGNAWPIANKLGWYDLKPFGFYKGMAIGVQGLFHPIAVEELYQTLQKIWGVQGTLVKASDRPIHSAAMITGSGHRFFPEAIEKRVDCFITGTADEPIWHMAKEEGVNFLCFGHKATETTGVQLLGRHLQEVFGLESIYIDEENPF